MAVSYQLLVDPYWNMLVMQRSTYGLGVRFTITLDRGDNIAFRAISVNATIRWSARFLQCRGPDRRAGSAMAGLRPSIPTSLRLPSKHGCRDLHGRQMPVHRQHLHRAPLAFVQHGASTCTSSRGFAATGHRPVDGFLQYSKTPCGPWGIHPRLGCTATTARERLTASDGT